MKVLQLLYIVKDLIFSLKNRKEALFHSLLRCPHKNQVHSLFLFFSHFAATTLTSKLMTSTLWESAMNPTGWWMAEKYDGVRLLWSGSQFTTRQGNRVNAPEFVTSALPRIALDGELW
jgi:ATP-dependent DNA ligase